MTLDFLMVFYLEANPAFAFMFALPIPKLRDGIANDTGSIRARAFRLQKKVSQ